MKLLHDMKNKINYATDLMDMRRVTVGARPLLKAAGIKNHASIPLLYHKAFNF